MYRRTTPGILSTGYESFHDKESACACKRTDSLLKQPQLATTVPLLWYYNSGLILNFPIFLFVLNFSMIFLTNFRRDQRALLEQVSRLGDSARIVPICACVYCSNTSFCFAGRPSFKLGLSLLTTKIFRNLSYRVFLLVRCKEKKSFYDNLFLLVSIFFFVEVLHFSHSSPLPEY